ncbi:MAG: MMPL family transporter [Prevotella sp.]|jgi:predicted exporter
MTAFILHIYDFLSRHRRGTAIALLALTAVLALLVGRINFREDISDFLPLDDNHNNALKVYQQISGAERLFVVFQQRDTTKSESDTTVAAINDFVAITGKADTAGWTRSMTSQVNWAQMNATLDFIYQNIPYFLTDRDYRRIDSLLALPDYIRQQLQADKQQLLFPTLGLLPQNIDRDPLQLFAPATDQLLQSIDKINFEIYNGYIFSRDMRRGFVMLDSPFGSSETENNGLLMELLHQSADKTMKLHPSVDIHVVGGPAIAVDNATQIKTDSLLSVSIAVVLILILLYLSIHSLRNLLLIVLSIAWGWLFAVAGLSLIHQNISLIVLGISSIILGIAVNYPLHLIAHLSHRPTKREALRDIVAPLLVGNITTVGAFLTLVPLRSIALRDLGLFSSMLLIGTILFVLIFLPHLANAHAKPHASAIDRWGTASIENRRWLVVTVVVLTVVFGALSLQTSFDPDISHINYMTKEQKQQLGWMQCNMTKQGGSEKVFVVSHNKSLDSAVSHNNKLQPVLKRLQAQHLIESHSDASRFLFTQKEQQERLIRWQNFVNTHSANLLRQIAAAAQAEGFSPNDFKKFDAILSAHYPQQPAQYFKPLAQSVLRSHLWKDGNRYNVIEQLQVEPSKVAEVESQLSNSGFYGFDIGSLNRAVASHLSDDFNYIGWACGFIVFFFLWASMGSIELAAISFVPMAVSWLWILGIMALCGFQFNIVNIILATFIFGQGDDYTIFMTEGASYEYAYRRKILGSYKHSIILSALIMFIGMGSLILARHPALHSLAEVVIVGMFSVVLMAYIFPPLLFKWLVSYQGKPRRRPITFVRIIETLWVRLLVALVPHTSPRACRFALRLMPNLHLVIDDSAADIQRSPIIVHSSSRLDALVLGALSLSTGNEGKHLCLHGSERVAPLDEWFYYGGRIIVGATTDEDVEGFDRQLAKKYDTPADFCPLVLDRYRYKGTEIYLSVKHCLREAAKLQKAPAVPTDDRSYGELALLYALMNPKEKVCVEMIDAEHADVLRYAAEGLAEIEIKNPSISVE